LTAESASRGAFSLVERITALEPGRRARGSCELPAGPAAGCLAAEAIGQLGAWVAIEHSGFKSRPIPALIAEVEMPSGLASRRRLDLEVEIEPADRGGQDFVVTNGRAVAGGLPVVELRDCLSLVLPLVRFDDPERVRDGFARLRGDGSTAGAPTCGGATAYPAPASPGLELCPRVHAIEEGPPPRLRAELRLPPTSAVFDDHFPRSPVLPASLLLDQLARLAVRLGGRAAHQTASPATNGTDPRSTRAARIHSVKLRAFVPPGARLELDVSTQASSGSTRVVEARAMLAGRVVTSATIELEPGDAA
jgi:3-hydroxymyristoyl/3-hydroxydecanoyl-(acyl carrier protein) dehydratase